MEAEPVLSTLRSDGGRRWLKPRLSPGAYWRARRIVAYGLVALFVFLPFLKINGKPVVLLDVASRHFTLFGYTFLPTDTILLALLLVGVFLGIFLVTALVGRAWCGWACPQTVYMEFVFRPLERLFEGTAGRGGVSRAPMLGLRKIAYYALVFLLCLALANVFLSYFVGVETLGAWMSSSPVTHPQGFAIVCVTTLLMLIDFTFFREQLCVLACPYGRFQSVLLDRQSTLVGYDSKRGEPRGALQPEAVTRAQGDCIDCKLCVATCPTGIDIRKGLQMECIACTQCIDACDTVMERIGKPKGLIRYCSQAELDGTPRRLLRPRVLAYPAVLLIIAGIFTTLLVRKSDTDITLLRAAGNPFTVLADGNVTNALKLKLTNRADKPVQYRFEILSPGDSLLLTGSDTLHVAPGEARTEAITVSLPKGRFAAGQADLVLRIIADSGFTRDVHCRLLGPVN